MTLQQVEKMVCKDFGVKDIVDLHTLVEETQRLIICREIAIRYAKIKHSELQFHNPKLKLDMTCINFD